MIEEEIEKKGLGERSYVPGQPFSSEYWGEPQCHSGNP